MSVTLPNGGNAGATRGLRSGVNSAIGSVQSFLFLSRERRSRTLVVANHWDGSVQQFYHFMLGYFFPLCVWLEKTQVSRISVRDCGPMNHWFETLGDHVDVQIVKPGAALHILAGRRMPCVVLDGLDNPTKFKTKLIRNGVQAVRTRLELQPNSLVKRIEVLVVDRTSSESFYRGPESETHMSGSERRSTPNLAKIMRYESDLGPTELVDFARLTPTDQICLAQRSNTIVGQHGAGLVHMLWLPEGSNVVEIAPPLPPEVQSVFRNLAKILGHNYACMSQESVHAPIDVNHLKNEVLRLRSQNIDNSSHNS